MKGDPHWRTRAKTAIDTERAVSLRTAGASFERIGKELGCSTSQAFRLVDNALKQARSQTREKTTEIVQLELRRLDRLLLALWPDAIKGDVSRVDRVLRIMERRSKLLGLDAPQKIAPTDPTGQWPYDNYTDEERDIRIIELLDLAAKARAADVVREQSKTTPSV